MQGYALSQFTAELTKVDDALNERPMDSFDVMALLGPKVRQHLIDRGYSPDSSVDDCVRRLPAEVLTHFLTVDQLTKVKYSQFITMDSSVEDLYQDDPQYSFLRKIENSMWRWGMGRSDWNAVVDAYNGIRTFEVPVDGFEVRLDYTTGHNERGFSRESRTFLDGVFGFLLYYRGEHVMTLGFSVAKDRKLLVQQVQLTKRKGNRFLFKLPANRMEFFLDCFAKAFPAFTICVADGRDVAQSNINSYKEGLAGLIRRKERGWHDEGDVEQQAKYETKIAHLEGDLPRLAAFYAGVGHFKRGETIKTNGIRHYALAA